MKVDTLLLRLAETRGHTAVSSLMRESEYALPAVLREHLRIQHLRSHDNLQIRIAKNVFPSLMHFDVAPIALHYLQHSGDIFLGF